MISFYVHICARAIVWCRIKWYIPWYLLLIRFIIWIGLKISSVKQANRIFYHFLGLLKPRRCKQRRIIYFYCDILARKAFIELIMQLKLLACVLLCTNVCVCMCATQEQNMNIMHYGATKSNFMSGRNLSHFSKQLFFVLLKLLVEVSSILDWNWKANSWKKRP